jgi:hypothetical protein
MTVCTALAQAFTMSEGLSFTGEKIKVQRGEAKCPGFMEN